MVHIGAAVGVDAGQQGHAGRQIRKIVPVDDQACRTRHGHQVQGVVGGAPGGQQTHDAVDDDFGIDLVAHARVGRLAELHRTLHRRVGEGFAQGRARVDKRRARQVQAHDLHQHLVGVGGTIEGAGAGAVVGRLLGSK